MAKERSFRHCRPSQNDPIVETITVTPKFGLYILLTLYLPYFYIYWKYQSLHEYGKAHHESFSISIFDWDHNFIDTPFYNQSLYLQTLSLLLHLWTKLQKVFPRPYSLCFGTSEEGNVRLIAIDRLIVAFVNFDQHDDCCVHVSSEILWLNDSRQSLWLLIFTRIGFTKIPLSQVMSPTYVSFCFPK